MSLVPRHPFGDDNFSKELSNFFNFTPLRFFGDMSVPNVDVYQTASDVVVKAEIPGAAREDLDLNIEENIIRISGKTKRDSKYSDENTCRTEMYYGSFSRTVPLPARVRCVPWP